MTAPQLINGLSDLSSQYDVVLSDIWGVIHDGVASFPGACDALARFNAEVGPTVLISNAARPSTAVYSQLDSLGVPRASWRGFVSSGDATRGLLAELAPGPAWKIGPTERDWPLYDGLGIAFSSIEDATFIACTGPDDDEVETPEDYRTRLAAAAARNLPMICANPDKVVQRGDKLIYCGGALGDLYETLGGTVRMAGKPHAPIYDLALAEAEKLLGKPLDRRRVLCVGDGIVTDVLGATNQGLDCVFIARGIHGNAAIGDHGKLDPTLTQALLARDGGQAKWAMADLVW
jgi:HAD superfamily hydrolase (TIGR01459 family)